MRMQSPRVAEVDDVIEGILAQCRSQVVLEAWLAKVIFDPALNKLTQLSDEALGYLRDSEPLMPLQGGRPMPVKKVWIVVSDSGLVLWSGSQKNRRFYEPTEEFKASMPADVDDLMVCPMWGKRLHVFSYKLEELINLAIQKYGRAVEIYAIIYWNGNELVGPDGVEDEPRYQYRPSCVDVRSVYNCKDLQVQYVDATLVAEHIGRADHYHGRKTVANVTKLTSFFTSLLHFMMQQKKFQRYEPAFDLLIARKLVLPYEDGVELSDASHAAAQKEHTLLSSRRCLAGFQISLVLAESSHASRLTNSLLLMNRCLKGRRRP